MTKPLAIHTYLEPNSVERLDAVIAEKCQYQTPALKCKTIASLLSAWPLGKDNLLIAEACKRPYGWVVICFTMNDDAQTPVWTENSGWLPIVI